MAIINLLPNALKRTKRSEEKKSEKSSPKFNWFGPILIIIFALFVGIWIALLTQVRIKEKNLAALEKKSEELKSIYKTTDELTQRKKELNETVALYQGLFGNNIIWSEKLYLINKPIPPQIWLTSISTDTQTAAGAKKNTTKTLVVKGSATSLMEREIVNSITQFIEQLKKDDSFSKDFQELKLGPIQSTKKGNFNIMNFSLYCKFK
jgi:Tfp pilus assembly protein PilN